MFLSTAQAQNRPAGQIKVGRMATTSPSDIVPGRPPQIGVADNVLPQVQTFIYGLVEYNSETCAFVSSGAWTVTTAPHFGATSTGIVVGYLNNGECPTTQFPFGSIYYTWTSKDPAGKSADPFAATWASSDMQEMFDVAITLIVPVNFEQVGQGVSGSNGLLTFHYEWASTSGNLDDLAQCQVGEYVSYPGGNPFVWPSPPYNGQTANPTIAWLAAVVGVAQDNQMHEPFLEPYVANAFNANQEYRYRCTSLDTVIFPGWSGITIARTVADSTGKGCWGYTVTKSGSTASLPRLPGVTGADCTSDASHEASQPTPSPATGGDQIGLSVEGSGAAVGLHAPIFVDLSILNRAAEPLSVDLGLNKKSNLELTIWGPTGGVTTRTVRSEGFGARGDFSLPPGGQLTQLLLLNQWYEFPITGSYRIKMTLLNSSFRDGGTGGAERPSVEFSVNIGERDPLQLESIARELADAAISASTIKQRMEAAEALSYIRDPAAVAGLARVLQHGSFVEQYAVDGLGRIGGPEAIAVLRAARNHPDEEVRAAVSSMLEALRTRAPVAVGP
jgi:hypothetical protein